MIYDVINENKSEIILKEPDVSKVKYKKRTVKSPTNPDKVFWNSIYMVKGKPYRVRVETLIFNKQGEVLVVKKDKPTKYGVMYSLPGGSIEPDTIPSQQAALECLEEARIIIKNIRYTGIMYQGPVNPPPNPYEHPKNEIEEQKKADYFTYYGYIVYVFVAEYDKKYKGEIDPFDEDKKFVQACEFVNIKEIDWRLEHIQAIKFYLKSKPEINKEIITLDDFETPEDLIAWCYNNIKGTNNKDDNRFYFPPEIFINKVGNCSDIAFLMHLFCDNKNISNKIFFINTEYIDNKNSKIINDAGHICCIYKKDNKWIIAQISGINDTKTKLTSCIFEGNENINDTIKEFTQKYIRGMNFRLKNRFPQCIILKSYYQLLTKKQIDQIDARYKNKDIKNKQDFLFKLRNEIKPVEINLNENTFFEVNNIENNTNTLLSEIKLLTLTMYHGSPYLYKEILPTAFSAGNKLFSKPSWAVFMFRQFESARAYACSQSLGIYFREEFKPEGKKIEKIAYFKRTGILNYQSEAFIREDIYNTIYKKLKDMDIETYVYELEVPIDKNLSIIGTTPVLPEYTYSGKVKTKKIHTIKITQELFTQLYKPISMEKHNELINNEKYLNDLTNLYGPFSKILYHDKKRKKMRKIVREKLLNGELKPGDDLSFLDDILNNNEDK